MVILLDFMYTGNLEVNSNMMPLVTQAMAALKVVSGLEQCLRYMTHHMEPLKLQSTVDSVSFAIILYLCVCIIYVSLEVKEYVRKFYSTVFIIFYVQNAC